MPFLRRRGNLASESDMRRLSLVDGLAAPKQPSLRSESTSDLPGTAAVLTSVAEDPSASPSVPASPAEVPSDAMSLTSSRHETPSSSFDVPSADSAGISATLAPPSESNRYRRFSMLRFRNASDSQLAAKAKLHAAGQKAPPLPRPPEIITTAPTLQIPQGPRRKSSRLNFTARLRRSGELSRIEHPSDETNGDRLTVYGGERAPRVPEDIVEGKQSLTFDESRRPASSHVHAGHDGGDDHSSTLALPGNRLSESSRSDGPSASIAAPASTSHTTSFFRLRRSKRQPEPLFPIAHLQPKSKTSFSAEDSSMSNSSLPRPSADVSPAKSPRASQLTPTPSRTPSRNGAATPTSQTVTLVNKAQASPATALFRPSSRQSGQSSPTRTYMHRRGRSSTLSSMGTPRESVDEHLAPPLGRTSISTGRKSFGDLFGLNRLRQTSELSSMRQGSLTPATPGSSASKNNSLQLPRDSIHLPERRDDDTPGKYLERLLGVVSRSVVAAALSKNSDTFSQAVLRSYMRSFMFFGDPMDMAIRKLLMEAELPKETQQIDRCLQAFANRYHECNPGIYSSPDQAYFIAFSLLILHTDVFNKNNKHKMQKPDYLKNTHGEGIYDDILEVFYDNITYTPFIHVEDDLDINGDRIVTHKSKKKSIFPNTTPDPAKRVAKEPVDPYTLIIDNRLDLLRPNLKDVMQLDDPYSYLGTAKSLNMKELQRTFFKTGVLQIVSARSRPDAFMTEKTATNPEEAHPGIVDIKITKVGLLWRKDAKKKRTRSPWQEWGAILTGAQLYFFRDAQWVRQLMHQHRDHLKKGHEGDPCIFHPPLEHFKPDALMSTDGAVALMDSSYNKHKHAFVYVKHGGFEEVLLAEDEDEMNDWLAKLNYAAAFRTSGVRMRGVVGGNYDGQGRRAIRRLDTNKDNTQVIQTPTGEVTISRSRIDHKMAQDILAARRHVMFHKVAEADEKLKEAETNLEYQLRNARHLQILAPISPKTREHMLLSAARMAAQLKWSRMEIWRLRCHRDILMLDLEEERQLLGLPASSELALNKDALTKEDTRTSNGAARPRSPRPRSPRPRSPCPRSPRSPAQLSLARSSTVTAGSDGESSPVTDVFQTPPTSATSPSFQGRGSSWELPGLTFDHADIRKESVSSAVSFSLTNPTTPPRNRAGEASAAEKPSFNGSEDEVDAGERDLLEKAGLLEPEVSRQVSHRRSSHQGVEAEKNPERRERTSVSGSTEKADKSKIRRSLQRTLKEGAGHISHHRHRKGKDSTSSGGAVSDETIRDAHPDVLTRSTGSFVVHGKKASVITFGSELQLEGLTAEERIRQRIQRDGAGNASGSAQSAPAESSSDFQSILTARSMADREHRESAASASTATARSFRELHRKYSSAQAAAGKSNGMLTLPSDEDSDAAVSFSEGRHTPLPPIDAEEEEEETTQRALERANGIHDEEEMEDDESIAPSREGRNTVYFTPEPPASPVKEEGGKEENRDGEEKKPIDGDMGHERLESSPAQAVQPLTG